MPAFADAVHMACVRVCMRACVHACVCLHDRLQVPFEEAVSSVRRQLMDIATGKTSVGIADAALRRNRDMFGRAVSFAAAMLTPEATSALLRAIDDLSQSNGEVAKFWSKEHRDVACKRAGVVGETQEKEASRLAEHGGQKDVPGEEVKKHGPPSSHLHVTLAHKRSHGAAQVASFARFVGSTVHIKVNQLLFNEHCAAVAVEVTGGPSAGESEKGAQEDGATSTQGAIHGMNAFPHVTVSKARAIHVL